MRLFNMKPAPSTTWPLPNRLSSDEVTDTMLRSLSTTERYVVWPSSTPSIAVARSGDGCGDA